MKILLAIDSFKGCLTSSEVEAIFAQALTEKGIEVSSFPMSDGGEGMLEAFITAVHGTVTTASVCHPLMRPLTASYGISPDGTAIIESAQACGLTLMKPYERNPMLATTYGVGELIVHAYRQGCRKFIVGLGGSGTSDCGTGMLQALADCFTPHKSLYELPDSPLAACHFILASDVRNPLYGKEGAAYTFASQKGASQEMIKQLDQRARQFAASAAFRMGIDQAQASGAGAAGGLGYAFLQFLPTTMQSGADLLLDLIHFDTAISQADLILTGEGHADSQTLMGKLPERILQRALPHHCPVWLVAGHTTHPQFLINAGFQKADSLTPNHMSLEEAILPETTKNIIRNWVDRNF